MVRVWDTITVPLQNTLVNHLNVFLFQHLITHCSNPSTQFLTKLEYPEGFPKERSHGTAAVRQVTCSRGNMSA